MSLNEHFSARAKTAHDQQIERACTRVLRDLQADVARVKKIVDGDGGVFTRFGIKGAGGHDSGILKYRLLRTASKGHAKFDIWYQNGQQMERLLREAVPAHPAFKKLHDYCAQAEHNFRIEHTITSDMSVGMVTHTHYVFDVIVTVSLQEPYSRSSRRLTTPPAPKPVAAAAPVVKIVQAPPAPLTKAQVTEYLRNLSNDRDKREFIELLGGSVASKATPRLTLKKPKQ